MPGSCLDQAGSSLDGTGWKTPQLHINVTANLWRNDCNSMVLSIVPSRLLSRPGFHINSPLAIPSRLSYKQPLSILHGRQCYNFAIFICEIEIIEKASQGEAKYTSCNDLFRLTLDSRSMIFIWKLYCMIFKRLKMMLCGS